MADAGVGDRMVRLEEQILFLGKDVSDLDVVMRRQGEEMATLRRELEDMRVRLLGVQQAMLTPEPEETESDDDSG